MTAPDEPLFARILCGVNASRSSREAVRQAIAIATTGAEVHFVAVYDLVGAGPAEMTVLGPERALKALQHARLLAQSEGVPASVDLVRRPHAAHALLELAEDHDLLVLGSHGHSRAEGIFLGRASALAVHRAAVPVLIARPPAAGTPFPGHVLAASDGDPCSREAVTTAARLAWRHGVSLTLLHVTDGASAAERHELAAQGAAAWELTGTEPLIVSEAGRPADRIPAVAQREAAGLIVLGSRGLAGMHALASVSERVAARAHCSVLVLRGDA